MDISKLDLAKQEVPDESLQKRVEKIENLTVGLVRNDSDGESYIYCAGVWVAKGYIVTAGHCALTADDPSKFKYTTLKDFKEKKIHNAQVISIDIPNDVGLILVDPSDEPLHENVTFKSAEVHAGDEIDIIGHPVGYDWSYIKGYVSAIRNNFPGPITSMEKLIQISSPAWMGNSGGGAFDKSGNLVGICSWVSKQGPFLSFFVHKDVVSDFLKKEKVLK